MSSDNIGVRSHLAIASMEQTSNICRAEAKLAGRG